MADAPRGRRPVPAHNIFANVASAERDIVGLPGIVSADWKSDERGYLTSIKQGTEVVIGDYKPNTGNVRIDQPFGTGSGWIKKNFLDIGTVKVGSGRADVNLPQIGTLHDPLASTQDQLSRGFSALAGALREKSGLLPELVPESLHTALAVPGTIVTIVNGLRAACERAGMLNVLNTPNFTVRDILNNPLRQPVNYADDRRGIYVIIYWDFKDDPQREAEIYVGRSTNYGRRESEHRVNTQTPGRSAHYQAAAAARQCCFIPVCVLLPAESENRLQLAEQFFILMFHAYKPALLDFQPRMRKEADEISLGYQEKEAATILDDLATRALDYARFPRTIGRPGFGAGRGLNATSPFLERISYDKTLWTMVKTPTAFIFRRAPFTCSTPPEQPKTRILGRIGNDPNMSIRIGDPADPGPQHGELAWPVVEILHKGRHPYALSRLPDVGCFTDWPLAQSLAIRIEYKKTGTDQWAYYWVHRAHWDRADDNVPGAFQSYAQAIGLMRFFLQRHYGNVPMPDWFIDFGMAKVKEIRRDWLTQSTTIQDFGRNPNPIPLPQRRDDMIIVQDLVRLGFENVGGPWQKRRESGEKRWWCDACYIRSVLTKPASGTRGCDRIAADQNHCTWCRSWGLPCSFTPTQKLRDSIKMQRAIAPYPPDKTEYITQDRYIARGSLTL